MFQAFRYEDFPGRVGSEMCIRDRYRHIKNHPASCHMRQEGNKGISSMVGDGFVVAYEKDGTWYILPYVFCSFIRNAFFENKYLFRYNSKIITLKFSVH